jgi:hypothetical protein
MTFLAILIMWLPVDHHDLLEMMGRISLKGNLDGSVIEFKSNTTVLKLAALQDQQLFFDYAVRDNDKRGSFDSYFRAIRVSFFDDCGRLIGKPTFVDCPYTQDDGWFKAAGFLEVPANASYVSMQLAGNRSVIRMQIPVKCVLSLPKMPSAIR